MGMAVKKILQKKPKRPVGRPSTVRKGKVTGFHLGARHLRLLDGYLKKGGYASRSEALRAYLEKLA